MKKITTIIAATTFALTSFTASANQVVIDKSYETTAFIAGTALACYNKELIAADVAELMVDTHIAKMSLDLRAYRHTLDDDRIMEMSQDVAAQYADVVDQEKCEVFNDMVPEILELAIFTENLIQAQDALDAWGTNGK